MLVVTKWILCWYKNVCKVLLQNYSFRLNPTRNMAAMGIYCFYWFVTLYKWCTRHVKSSITIPHLIKVGRVQNMTHGIDGLFLFLICWNSMYSLPTELQIQFVCNGHKWCLLYLLQIFCISFSAKYMGHVNNIFFFNFCTPKLHERMFCNLVQMMLVGSSTKILHSIIIRKKYSLNKQMAMFAVI